ncbi:MAG: hypothetical protein IJV04_10245, partial [Lachnospiraceae bacterium]|nr:hypothetical protein [Lachnospiraceae bacterium]
YMDFLDTEYYKGNVDDKYIPAEQIGEISSRKYDNGIANSVMINSEAELDRIVHEMVTKINDLLSPTVAVSDSGEVAGIADKMKELNEVNGTEYSMALSAVIVHDQDSWTHTMSADNLRIFDKQNACVGSDREIPTKELFARAGVERYRTVTVEVPYGDKNGVGIYHYTDAGTGQRERAYPVYETTDGRRAYLVLDENGNSTADEDGNLLYVDGDGKSVSYKGIRGYFTDDNGVIQYAKTDGTNWTGLTESEATTVAADKTETFTAYAYNDEGLARRFNTSTKQWEISRSLDSNTGQWVLDRDCCYTLSALSIEESVMTDPSLIAHLHQNGDIAYDLSQSIYALWNSSDCTLNPSDVTTCSYSGFYTKIVGELATTQSVYKTMSDSLENTRQSIENNRQAVIGVSTDEELQTMIKFQNAYNASSRYINVVNSMIETLINSCGTIR